MIECDSRDTDYTKSTERHLVLPDDMDKCHALILALREQIARICDLPQRTALHDGLNAKRCSIAVFLVCSFCLLGSSTPADSKDKNAESSMSLTPAQKRLLEMLNQKGISDEKKMQILDKLIAVLGFDQKYNQQIPYFKQLLTLKERVYGKTDTIYLDSSRDYDWCLQKAAHPLLGHGEGDPSADAGYGYDIGRKQRMKKKSPILKGNIRLYRAELLETIMKSWRNPTNSGPPTIALHLALNGKLLRVSIIESSGKECDSYTLHMIRNLVFPPYPNWYDGKPYTFRLCLQV